MNQKRSKAPVGCDFCDGINPSYAMEIGGKWWCTSCDWSKWEHDAIKPCPNCEKMDFVDLVRGPLVRCGTCDLEATPEVWSSLPRREDFRCELCEAEKIMAPVAKAAGSTREGLRALLRKLKAERDAEEAVTK